MSYFKREPVLLSCVVAIVVTTTLFVGQAKDGRPVRYEQGSHVAGIAADTDRGELPIINPWWRIRAGNGSGEVAQSSPPAIDVPPRDGLRSVEFLSERGKVTVHLPDDVTAGATLSGTVSVLPAGGNERERLQNAEALNNHVIDLAGQEVRAGSQRFKWSVPISASYAPVPLLLKDSDRREIAREELSVGSRLLTPPESFDYPSLIEQGRPFEIRGPFDGDFANTKLTINGVELAPLAESQGKVIARHTTNSPGVAALKCDELGVVSEGQVRILAVRLGADKLKLLRGEQTTLRITVSGLKGLKEVTPLVLLNESTEIVSMSGGDRQNITVNPQAQDGFSTERVLTGITPGGFRISARLDARLYDVWLKTLPDAETWFDTATDTFRRGRQLAGDASDAAGRGEDAGTRADEALSQLNRARTYVQKAVAAGEISDSTATSLREYISQFEAEAKRAKERPPATAIAVSSPTPDPFSRPSPTPSATVTEGRFEPSQGVWQDDEYFEDKPTKRLTRTGPASWVAELKMVVGRRTALFGIREDRRVRIFIRGTTNGTRLTPVKFRFTLFYGGKKEVVYEDRRAENAIPLDGPIGPVQPFEASLLSSIGIPETHSFKIDSPGSYRIEGELVRNNGTPTGLKVVVRGDAIVTQAPKFRFVPVILSDPVSQSFDLETQASRLVLLSYLMDEFLPVKPSSITAKADPAHDLRSLGNTAETQDSLIAAIGQRFGTASSLTGGEKIGVLLSEKDFALTTDPQGTFAYAVSQKVFVLQPAATQYTIAHEFIHTTPFPWAEKQMVSECGLNYHNSADANYGNGVVVGSYQHTRMDRVRAVMGPAFGADTWITQCSYWHLLKYLVGTPDPDLLLVRGYLKRSGQSVTGSFDKFYELRGETELAKGQRTAEQFSIVLRDRAGGVLAEYPFTAVWKIPDIERERTIIPFTFRVETFPALHRVELVGPAGVLDTKTLSTSPPSVKILTPGSHEVVRSTTNGLPVTWRATDPDGDSLSYSVYYSPDGGRNWRLVSYEQTNTSFVIPIRGRPRDARVRVVATDGGRSSTDQIGFSFER